MLIVKDVSLRYGMIQALYAVSLQVNEGQIVSLIGANGAGKSSLLNAISCVQPISSGCITFDGVELQSNSPEQLVRLGIVQVPEGRQVFASMSVEENLVLGAYAHRKTFSRTHLDPIYALFPRLAERRKQPAGLMSGGEQQMLAIGRAMMSRPRILLLDEPSMGLAPLVVKSIFQTLRELNGRGVSLLLVEQNAKAAMRLSDYTYVLTVGEVTRHGPSDVLVDEPEIREAFLGKSSNGKPGRRPPCDAHVDIHTTDDPELFVDAQIVGPA